ncbi:hypothetical protein JCGZ_20774 [Jatropha curcas]|uniref:pectinesterase n=1 Tax=Jatropha curcas TaxID=180498 RepID=A0A067JS00_JATCU|nr:21 kDa protein [Jatropha curcas]KDP25618.1 hypothetical protein JCGZ_20774 [Jatropha curcas]
MEGPTLRVAIIIILPVFILFFSIQINFSSADTNTQYVQASCSNTTYPELCYSSLSCYARKIQRNPKTLAYVALNVTLTATKSASEFIKTLYNNKLHGLKPKEAAAMADCVELADEAVDELERSIGKMGRARGSNSDPVINDIQTWVSAALTDDNTCMDGFSGDVLDGEVKSIVLKNMTQVAQLTSVALALVNRFASSKGNSVLVL